MLDFPAKFHILSTGQINDLQPKCKMEIPLRRRGEMSENLRVLVCGGRDYGDIKSVFVALDEHAKSAELIVHGGSRGADALAQLWADTTGVCCKVYPANWKTHGKAAGPIRNQAMLDNENPDLIVAFPGGRGTADMMKRAREAGVKVVEIPSPPSVGR